MWWLKLFAHDDISVPNVVFWRSVCGVRRPTLRGGFRRSLVRTSCRHRRRWWDVFFVVASSEICSRCRAALTEAFTLVGRPVDEDLGGDDVAKREEHLHEFAVTELLGQVVDEQVAALGSWDRASYHINQSTSKHLNLKYNTQVRMLVLGWVLFFAS